MDIRSRNHFGLVPYLLIFTALFLNAEVHIRTLRIQRHEAVLATLGIFTVLFVFFAVKFLLAILPPLELTS